MRQRSSGVVALETAATAIGGGVLGWALGSIIGATDLLTAIAAANGAVGGRAGVYNWRETRGWVAFVVDSTWALIGTAVALVLHLVQPFFSSPGYRFDLSSRANLHVYEGGFSMKPAYAFSVGNVISNAGGKTGLDGEDGPSRRWKFIQNHEFLHVFQNRLFGPTFQLAYLGWMLFGAGWGFVVWLNDRRDLGRLIETAAYFNNPFEYWAYVRDGYWPPGDAHPRIAWAGRRVTRSPGKKGT